MIEEPSRWVEPAAVRPVLPVLVTAGNPPPSPCPAGKSKGREYSGEGAVARPKGLVLSLSFAGAVVALLQASDDLLGAWNFFLVPRMH